MIDEAMARAEKVACSPGESRCYVFPDTLAEARATCTPKGRCCIGWIVANGGRDSWVVWLDLHTGEGRLRRMNASRAAGLYLTICCSDSVAGSAWLASAAVSCRPDR